MAETRDARDGSRRPFGEVNGFRVQTAVRQARFVNSCEGRAQ